MALNNVELDQILFELNLRGSILQKVKPVNYESFVFFFYKTREPIDLFISLDKNCRMYRNSKKMTYLGKSHNLVEFMKAYIVGGVVLKAEQLNNNRIIKIEILNKNTTYLLFIRLWGGFSNIIITDTEYKILHLHKKSSKKLELPGEKLIIPPPKNDSKIYVLKDHKYQNYNRFIEEEYLNQINEQDLEKETKKKEAYINQRTKEINKQLIKLEKRLNGYLDLDTYKLYGDLILSNMYKIKKGDANIVVNNYLTGNDITIGLNPELEPFQNSEAYYKKHKKALSGVDRVKEQINNLTHEKETLEYTNISDIKTSSNKVTPTSPGLTYFSGDWEILVGRNAKENEALLRSYVKGNDMWLHVRDFPGGYIFIKSKKNKTIPLEVLLDGGILALYYSKAKSNLKADVSYTHVKYLRKVKKGKPGQVIVTMDKNIFVTLDKKRLDVLKP